MYNTAKFQNKSYALSKLLFQHFKTSYPNICTPVFRAQGCKPRTQTNKKLSSSLKRVLQFKLEMFHFLCLAILKMFFFFHVAHPRLSLSYNILLVLVWNALYTKLKKTKRRSVNSQSAPGLCFDAQTDL